MGGSSRYSTNGATQAISTTAKSAYDGRKPSPNADTSAIPMITPMACGADTQLDTTPRWKTGTWSLISAVSAADTALKPVSAAHHPMVIAMMLSEKPSPMSPAANNAVPPTIHGRRRP